ncbi:SH3 domain-containing protein [Phototrophicus methaneseepsis]|uniref:SH3 domain-containing protein n=1 Tax=Phototrophicus methaneseepsis TaxID=2710758 RepID=A0A7S8EC76_9CHLR|nr:SH3 domain-containing protein [Phototrophicus methaneseepsis]QPC84272.1 SH3 domain-containing protein [Phototrophicus methaneseepsis]
MRHQLMIIVLTTIAMLFGASIQPAYAADTIPCYQPTRLSAGYNARVTTQSNLPNRMRSEPSLRNNVIGRIPAGAEVYVIEGPRCEEGFYWWRVQYGNLVGWTAEGNGWNLYWLEPSGVVGPGPTPVVCALPNRLNVGGNGRVTPGLPNVVRSAPGTQSTGAYWSVVLGEIPGGGVFNVLNGPQCGTDGRWWWEVQYQDLVGWTAEGEGINTYWVEPVDINAPQCAGFMVSRLIPGGLGRVTTTPNLPNHIRTLPGYANTSLGLIPAGGWFTVMSGPYCADNTAWWQVSYGDVVGWTAEGQGNTYWLEPR